MPASRKENTCEHRKPASPINVEDGRNFSRDSANSPIGFQPQAALTPSTSIAAIAKEFQESKISDIVSLIKNEVPVILVTTQKWDYVPLMFEGMHYIYEGYIVDVQEENYCRSFIMRLSYPNRKSPLCVQFTNNDVVSLLPRHGHRNKPEECSYFHLHGHCAFGLNCHKAHDPKKLCEKVKERLRSGDIKILNENQQHTLHIAMVEEGINESEMRSHFEPFGPLKSVKIEPGRSLLQGSAIGWRIGFVTFHYARDAIRAKKILNEDPKSKFRGLVQFSKQPTKNHASNAAHTTSPLQLSLPRSGIYPRLDKPTEQLYLHRLPKELPTTCEEIKRLLKFPKGDYALVLFDSVQDGMSACHTLLATNQREWALDFHPVEDRTHLKIRFLRWQTLRRDEAIIMKFISQFWNGCKDEDGNGKLQLLFEELKSVKSEIQDAEDQLTKLVFQAVRQADTQMKREGAYLDIFQLGAAIGPDAVAFAEEKTGSLRDFVDSQRQSPLFNIQDSCVSKMYHTDKVRAGFVSEDRLETATSPLLYFSSLDHVDYVQQMPSALVEAFM